MASHRIRVTLPHVLFPPFFARGQIQEAIRAAEEKRGIIHWLRPGYQAGPERVRGSGQKSEVGGQRSGQKELGLPEGEGKAKARPAKSKPAAAKPAKKVAWPKSLSERVKAVSEALAGYQEPVTAEEMAKRFTRAKEEDVAEILETLCTMGLAHRGKGKGMYLK